MKARRHPKERPTGNAATRAADERSRVAGLGRAVRSGNVAALRKLMDAGGDANERVGGVPLLVLAIRAKRERVVELLLSRGADPDAFDEEEDAPVIFEAIAGNGNGSQADVDRRTRMTVALLDAGANPNVRDGTGATPLWYACSFGMKASALIRRLLRDKPDLRAKNDDKVTILHLAGLFGLRDVAAAAIAAGANVNARCFGGAEYALAMAVSKKHEGVADLLFAAGAKPGLAVDDPFEAAISHAVWNRDIAMIRKLRIAGAKTSWILEYVRGRRFPPKILAALEDPVRTMRANRRR